MLIKLLLFPIYRIEQQMINTRNRENTTKSNLTSVDTSTDRSERKLNWNSVFFLSWILFRLKNRRTRRFLFSRFFCERTYTIQKKTQWYMAGRTLIEDNDYIISSSPPPSCSSVSTTSSFSFFFFILTTDNSRDEELLVGCRSFFLLHRISLTTPVRSFHNREIFFFFFFSLHYIFDIFHSISFNTTSNKNTFIS